MRLKSKWRDVSRRHAGWLLVIVAGFALAAAPAAGAASLQRLTSGSVDAFASDGVEYAVWQAGPRKPIVVLDTRDGRRREITPPAGCELKDNGYNGGTGGTAAAGRFLLFCRTGEELLDVRSGKSVKLPTVEPGGGEYSWSLTGTLYVVGPEAVYDIATGEVSEFSNAGERADPNAPGASMDTLCPAVRSLAASYQPVIPNSDFAYTRKLFARESGRHGDAQLDRCHGSPTILRARRRESEAKDFDLRGGLLSWDTGLTEAHGSEVHRGILYAYDLASHKCERWELPINRGVEEEYEHERGTFGYSTHTANTVFWLADAETSEGMAPSVDRWIVYAAKR